MCRTLHIPVRRTDAPFGETKLWNALRATLAPVPTGTEPFAFAASANYSPATGENNSFAVGNVRVLLGTPAYVASPRLAVWAVDRSATEVRAGTIFMEFGKPGAPSLRSASLKEIAAFHRGEDEVPYIVAAAAPGVVILARDVAGVAERHGPGAAGVFLIPESVSHHDALQRYRDLEKIAEAVLALRAAETGHRRDFRLAAGAQSCAPHPSD